MRFIKTLTRVQKRNLINHKITTRRLVLFHSTAILPTAPTSSSTSAHENQTQVLYLMCTFIVDSTLKNVRHFY